MLHRLQFRLNGKFIFHEDGGSAHAVDYRLVDRKIRFMTLKADERWRNHFTRTEGLNQQNGYNCRHLPLHSAMKEQCSKTSTAFCSSTMYFSTREIIGNTTFSSKTVNGITVQTASSFEARMYVQSFEKSIDSMQKLKTPTSLRFELLGVVSTVSTVSTSLQPWIPSRYCTPSQ